MSLGNLLFFTSIILFLLALFLVIFIFIFECIGKEKITNKLLKMLFVLTSVAAVFMLTSIIILYFELGG